MRSSDLAARVGAYRAARSKRAKYIPNPGFFRSLAGGNKSALKASLRGIDDSLGALKSPKPAKWQLLQRARNAVKGAQLKSSKKALQGELAAETARVQQLRKRTAVGAAGVGAAAGVGYLANQVGLIGGRRPMPVHMPPGAF